MSTLEIKDLHVEIEGKEILKGVNLTLKTGEIAAIMGPNGTGKSTLSAAIMGNPNYEVTKGEILFDGVNILELEVDERARMGLFLAMQYPSEIPGITNAEFLRAAMNAGKEEDEKISIRDFIKKLDEKMELLNMKEEMAEYVADNLTQIRHTHVKTTIGTDFQVDYEPRYEELKGTVSSVRLDSVLALAYPLSRSKITAQIEAGKVFVNGKLITSNGYRLKENDIISVRKMGRISYNGILSET